MKSIAEAIKLNSTLYPDKICIACNNSNITYFEFYNNALAFARSLKSRGIKKGSRIVLEASDLISYFCAHLGCQLCGCIAVPVEENVSIYKLQDILKTTKPALVFMKNNGESYQPFFNTANDITIRLPKEDNISSIVAATGTTGEAVFISHSLKSSLAAAQNLIEGIGMVPEDVAFSDLPFYLSVGIRRVFAGLVVGATVILHQGELTQAMLTDYIDKYKINHIALNNSGISLLLDKLNASFSKSMEGIESVESVSAQLTEAIIRDFHKTYPKVILYNIYGTTESGCLLINNTHENSVEGCLGKPTVNTDIILVDENGSKITTPGEYGHICVKGKMNMVGYYRKKALTDEVMQGDYITINDIAYFDKDGYFYFVSRVGDIIDVKGNKIIPAEIEKIISAYNGIDDCALVAAKNSRNIHIPVLYISTNENYSEEAFNNYLNKNLESYKQPQKTIIIDKIPRSATGKILRKALEIN